MIRLKGLYLFLGLFLALAASLGFFAQEALAESPEVRVTLTLENTAMVGSYEIQTIILTRGFFPILTQYFFPPASILPGRSETFSFDVRLAPDGLTIKGKKDTEMFSFTFYPIYSGFTGTKDSLMVTVHFEFLVPPSPWPPYPCPTPPCPPTVDPAKIQADLNKGSKYFAIAEQANKSLTPEEKTRLAQSLQPLFMEAEAVLGGRFVPSVKAYIPPELHGTLTSIAQRLNNAVITALTAPGVLGVERANQLNLLVPMTELTLRPPQTQWTCYWSYVYAWWTFVCAYWNYIVNDHPLGLWTLIYAYYSCVYAYWCYIVC